MKRGYDALSPAELVAEVRRRGWDVRKVRTAIEFVFPEPDQLPVKLVEAIAMKKSGVSALLAIEAQEKPIKSMIKGTR